MPSKDIVRGIQARIQKQLIPTVNKKWVHQFKFGLQAYSLRPFTSVTGNARMVGSNTKTAIRKSERLFTNPGLTDSLGSTFNNLGLVKPSSFVNCDHSDMNRLTAFVGAVQTRKGRAIPCLIETTYSDRLPGHGSGRSTPRTDMLRRARASARKSQSFTGHYIDALQNFHDRLGFWPKLVFDRGFGNYSLVTHLQAEGAIFYIRLKAGRFVELGGQITEVKRLKDNDAVVELFGLKLRVIRSAKSRRANEPWYILTNDSNSSRERIIRIYYHRFEIEETFKDIKHIWEFKRTRLNKPNSLKLMLWLISFGIALLHQVTSPIKQSNPRKRISWIRQAYEQLQQAVTSSLLLTG